MSAAEDAGRYSPAVLRRVRLGIALVGCAAAVLSFDALADLGRLAGLSGMVSFGPFRFYLAWLLPLSVDAFAIVGSYIWLRRIGTDGTVQYAMCCALTAIGSTLVGNGYHGYLISTGAAVPWGAAVAVAAVAPISLGGLVHLGMLVERDVEAALAELPTPVGDPAEPEWRTAYRLGLDDALAVEWTLALAGWSAPPTEGSDDGEDDAEPGSWAPPARGESDDVFAADLRSVNLDRGSADLDPLPRDAVIARYGVGARRARRLRELAERPAPAEVGRDTADPGRVPVGRGAGEQLDPDPIARATRSERDVDAEPVGAGSGPGRPGSGVVGRAEV